MREALTSYWGLEILDFPNWAVIYSLQFRICNIVSGKGYNKIHSVNVKKNIYTKKM